MFPSLSTIESIITKIEQGIITTLQDKNLFISLGNNLTLESSTYQQYFRIIECNWNGIKCQCSNGAIRFYGWDECFSLS